MDPIIVHIDDRLANAGDTVPCKGHIAQEGYSLGEHDFSLPSGVDYDLMLTNAGEGILVTGLLTAHVEGTCDRCLEAACFDVAGEVDEYYLYEAPAEEDQGDDEDDVDFSLVLDDDTIDLTDALTSALLMETPFVVLCTPDCKGLCPTCGANLNEGDCGCAAKAAAEPDPASPFAVLKDFDVTDDVPPAGE
ncbi:MAG: DUF177 domain-containing protein [Atopobiaceae bacterium]|jgi:uncharacterized protein|nr:DUF177 domain-containing protein [Atopobiaceae bacterium]MCH4180639.1 DUF177 domain-containing protein [Atopobiaceae bacterium]MCH4215091.1 DUF177 domain-containing protein [Atopobiaceae bacterium]MCH4230323.1 DUF177 domain-containing protein [Atopobiaceae bacterium]MCH4277263.1 DUF177 domain-containing protein [Atopobiaceae bacterium]